MWALQFSFKTDFKLCGSHLMDKQDLRGFSSITGSHWLNSIVQEQQGQIRLLTAVPQHPSIPNHIHNDYFEEEKKRKSPLPSCVHLFVPIFLLSSHTFAFVQETF